MNSQAAAETKNEDRPILAEPQAATTAAPETNPARARYADQCNHVPAPDAHDLRDGDVIRPEIQFDNESCEDGDGKAVRMYHFLNGMDAALEGLKSPQPGTVDLILPGYVWMMIKLADFDTAAFLSEIIMNSVELRKRWLQSKYMGDDEIEILLKAMHEEGHRKPMTAN